MIAFIGPFAHGQRCGQKMDKIRQSLTTFFSYPVFPGVSPLPGQRTCLAPYA